MWLQAALVFLGGGIGALARFGVEHLHWFDNNKYYYTLGINLTGCLLIGVVWSLLHYYNASRYWDCLLVIGFFGGYTTFSAFSLDAILLMQHGMWLRAFIYIALTFIGGLGCCAISYFLMQKILKG